MLCLFQKGHIWIVSAWSPFLVQFFVSWFFLVWLLAFLALTFPVWDTAGPSDFSNFSDFWLSGDSLPLASLLPCFPFPSFFSLEDFRLLVTTSTELPTWHRTFSVSNGDLSASHSWGWKSHCCSWALLQKRKDGRGKLRQVDVAWLAMASYELAGNHSRFWFNSSLLVSVLLCFVFCFGLWKLKTNSSDSLKRFCVPFALLSAASSGWSSLLLSLLFSLFPLSPCLLLFPCHLLSFRRARLCCWPRVVAPLCGLELVMNTYVSRHWQLQRSKMQQNAAKCYEVTTDSIGNWKNSMAN